MNERGLIEAIEIAMSKMQFGEIDTARLVLGAALGRWRRGRATDAPLEAISDDYGRDEDTQADFEALRDN